MGRARSRRRRGKTGGAGSGGSGKGKGTGGSRGRSSSNKGGQGSGGSGSGKGTGGSKGRSNANRNTKKNNNRVKVNKTNEANKQARVNRRNERLKKQFGLDYNDMKDSFRIKINPTQWLGGFTEKTGIPTGLISRNLPGFIKNMKIDHQLKSPNKVAVKPGDSKWGGGVAKDILLATQAKQAQKAQQKAETKALDKQYKNDQAIYNNNKKNMSVTISKGSQNKSNTGPNTSDKDWLKGAYKTAFGPDREANFDAKGGAQYWLDQMASNPTSHSRDEVLRMLKGSDEGKKFAASGVTMPGGVDPSKSIHSQFNTGNTWLEHWAPGGSLAPDNIDNTFTDVNKSLSTINPNATYTNFDDKTFKPGGPGPGDGGTLPVVPKPDGGWWTKFADADAFKKFLTGDQQKSDGMGDFMKFMMLMNVMRPGGGGGYGGGGSQFGYGGLNPGGVQAAYDPMKQLQGMGTWFKDNFGSGSGTTTSTVNTN